LFEEGSIESIADVQRLEHRTKLVQLESATPELRKQLEDFLEEHSRVASDRDQFKLEAATYATEVDELARELNEVKGECATYKDRLEKLGLFGETKKVAEIFKTLPSTLVEVATAASLAFPRLVITKKAIETAEDFHECSCVAEAWEMLVHLSETLHPLKFEERAKDLEGKFKSVTRFELGMSEGKMTKDSSKFMNQRRLIHEGVEYDITPHLKHGNAAPKLVRIHFAFDETKEKIIVGHIGDHLETYGTKRRK